MDWTKLKNEYITGHTSYRKLAENYGLSLSTLTDRAKKEKWFEKRKKYRNDLELKTLQKTADKLSDVQSDLAADIYSAATELLKKLNIAIEQTNLFIEKTKNKIPESVLDENTGEILTAWTEEENIRLSHKDSINIASVRQIASALRDLQIIQNAPELMKIRQKEIELKEKKVNAEIWE